MGERDSRGRADLAAWLAEWSLLLRVQPAITAEALVQLGWNESIEDLVAAARAKEDDWREFGVWHCDVVHEQWGSLGWVRNRVRWCGG